MNDARQPKLLLLDSASLYFRAFFGVPDQRKDLAEPPTNAVRGFLDMIASLVTTFFAAQAMMAGFFAGGVNALEWLAIILFSLNLFYLGIAAYTGLAGTIVLLLSPKPPPPSSEPLKSDSKTAIVIALYQENPSKVIAAAEAMWDSLKDLDAEKGFEVFFLSDTHDPALAEIEVVVAGARADEVRAVAERDGVVAGQREDAVGPAQSTDRVHPAAADDAVVAVGPGDVESDGGTRGGEREHPRDHGSRQQALAIMGHRAPPPG